MTQILYKDILLNSNLWKAILSIFGLGTIIAKYTFIKLGILRPIILDKLDEKEISWISNILRKLKLPVGPELEIKSYLHTNALKAIKTYRALRMRQGLPNRGQRTHTNAKTARRLKGLWESSFYAKRMASKRKKKKQYLIFKMN